MNAEDVARYLQEHQEFFEEYADLLANIFVSHPHGGRAIPISERQIITLREKNRLMEDKLRELIKFAEENDAIGEKMQRISMAMLTAGSLQSLLHSMNFNLREDFAVPHVALRVWGMGEASPALPELSPASEDLRGIAEGLSHPYCGTHVAEEVIKWFGEGGAHLRSFALVALHHDRTIGMLALASEDPRRFYPEMGTLYLKRLGELVSAAVARYLEKG